MEESAVGGVGGGGGGRHLRSKGSCSQRPPHSIQKRSPNVESCSGSPFQLQSRNTSHVDTREAVGKSQEDPKP